MAYDSVLVTGGAGFIGSHTVDALLNEGYSTWVLDDLSTGSLRNLRRLKSERKFHFRRGSTLQPKLVESIARKVDAIIHLAAIISPYYSVKKPKIVNSVNVTGTINVLNAAVQERIQKLVFASSSSVYGNQTLLPIVEDSSLHPFTPYGASKLAGEKYCEAYFRTYGLKTIALRYFNVYGARQSANPYSGVIAIFAKKLKAGLCPTIFGDGKQTRDFVHVSDVVRANLQALASAKGIGEAFNVGTGHPTTVNELSSLLAGLCRRPELTPRHLPDREGDIRDSYSNMTKANAILSFQPKTGLKQGLQALLHSKP